MITTAVILAAGMGSRLRDSDTAKPKPLQTVAGRSLLERTLSTLKHGGIERAVVVVGFRADEIRSMVETDRSIAALGIEIVMANNAAYERSNGVSALAAREYVSGPFVLSMSDHIYDASIARLTAAADLADCDLVLAVDRRINDVYDLPDATKVRTEEDRIVDIGKELATYDCIDCGVFAMGPALFDALAEVQAQRGDCSLSDGVRLLAARGRARVIDIGDAFWQDVDTLGALHRAESILIA